MKKHSYSSMIKLIRIDPAFDKAFFDLINTEQQLLISNFEDFVQLSEIHPDFRAKIASRNYEKQSLLCDVIQINTDTQSVQSYLGVAGVVRINRLSKSATLIFMLHKNTCIENISSILSAVQNLFATVLEPSLCLRLICRCKKDDADAKTLSYTLRKLLGFYAASSGNILFIPY